MKNLIVILILSSFAFEGICGPIKTSLTHDNRNREFIIYLPTDYNPNESLPLVLNLHPLLTNGRFQMEYSEYNHLADTARCIVVYPFGLNGRWNSGAEGQNWSNIDDIGFMGKLIDYMSLFYNIDETRVYATGFSNGGFMSYKMACEITNRIAAIAPVAASMSDVDGCFPTRVVPTMITHGTADPIVPLNGFFGVESTETVVNYWNEVNECDNFVEEELPNISNNDGSRVVKRTYLECAENSEVTYYKVLNGGHVWPGASTPWLFFLGNTNQDFSQNAESWSFFKRHVIPSEIVCGKPQNLEVNIIDDEVYLSWDQVEGIDFYNVFINNGPQSNYLENVMGNEVTIPFEEGELAWAVRAQCESGHVAWSKIQQDDIGGRYANQQLILTKNPVNEQLSFKNFEEVVGQEIMISNLYGKVYKTLVVSNNSLDVSDLISGIYYLTVLKTGASQSFIKQ